MQTTATDTTLSFDEMGSRATEAAELLSAMAHPARLLILCSLVNGELAVNELVAKCGSSQSAVSQHLAKMRHLKLVSTRRAGQTIYYQLASKEVRQVLTTLYEMYCNKK